MPLARSEDVLFSPPMNAPAPASKPTLRLEFLEGLRGLAAFYVMLHHAYLQTFAYDETRQAWLPPAIFPALHWLDFGHYAVAVFIVLSGYLLMIPVVRSENGSLRGGFWDYLKRRSRRILPPYYAAVAFSLLLAFLIPDLSMFSSSRWVISLPMWKVPTLLTHLTLTHNLFSGMVYKINHTHWSVATEWQIYFLFPLVLLPLWRRFGMAAPFAAGLAISLPLRYLLHNAFSEACFWFIALFALGMAGATLSFSRGERQKRWRTTLPWGSISAFLAAGFLALGIFRSDVLGNYEYVWMLDLWVGLAAASFLVYGTNFFLEARTRLPRSVAFFDSKPLVWLGSFSYSLYLTHAVVLAAVQLELRNLLPPSPAIQMLVSMTLGAAASLIVGYLFFLGFERPFLRTKPKAAFSRPPQP